MQGRYTHLNVTHTDTREACACSPRRDLQLSLKWYKVGMGDLSMDIRVIESSEISHR